MSQQLTNNELLVLLKTILLCANEIIGVLLSYLKQFYKWLIPDRIIHVW